MKQLFFILILIFTTNNVYPKKISYPINFSMPIIVDGSVLEGSKPILGSYLYMKETEVSNQEYRSFLNWTKSMDQSIYNLMYPDTNVWGKGFEAFRNHYFQSNAFQNMPVVGVSQKHAMAYCNWLQTKYNDYLELNTESKIKKVIVRLASEQEWIMAAEGGQKPGANYPWPCEGVRYCGPDKKHIGKFLLNCKFSLSL